MSVLNNLYGPRMELTGYSRDRDLPDGIGLDAIITADPKFPDNREDMAREALLTATILFCLYRAHREKPALHYITEPCIRAEERIRAAQNIHEIPLRKRRVA